MLVDADANQPREIRVLDYDVQGEVTETVYTDQVGTLTVKVKSWRGIIIFVALG